MQRMARWLAWGTMAGAVVVAQSCGEATGPAANDVSFEISSLDLSTLRDTAVTVRNTGSQPVGPIDLVPLEVRSATGNTVSGPRLVPSPVEIATLNPGDSRRIALTVDDPGDLPNGTYRVGLEARTPGRVLATTMVQFLVDNLPPIPVGSTVEITGGPTALRQGEVDQFTAEVRDPSGAIIPGAPVQWVVVGDGLFDQTGRFVPYQTGTVRVIARAADVADTAEVTVTPRNLAGTFATVGHTAVPTRTTSDLWLYGSTALTGTWGARVYNDSLYFGNTMYVWDVTAADPVLTDSIVVEATTVNDVKIRADGQLAVLTHEGSDDNLNGITLVSMADPQHPTVITRYTNTLTTGVHNAWIEGNYVYLVVDGVSPSSGLRILDISNPATPVIVASFYGGTSFLHDVYVRDGLAFLSHWDAGLIILDVGNGMAGGSPTNPVEVSRIQTAGGETHNAWYWPAGGYVFVGEEDFSTPGVMHVVDVHDLHNPKEVATFRSSGATPHNLWLDESRGVLYAAWYYESLQAIDVTGELVGELERQARGYQVTPYPTGQLPLAWAPQLQNGRIYVSDMNTGLWVMQPSF